MKNSPRHENETKRQKTNNGKSQVVKSKIPVVHDVDIDIETESYGGDDEIEDELESNSENSHDSSWEVSDFASSNDSEDPDW